VGIDCGIEKGRDDMSMVIGRLGGQLHPTVPEMIRAIFSLPAEAACKTVFHKFLGAVGPEVRLANAVHTVVFAPTGVGKGASFVIPHLLRSPNSCVVVDFKGENAAATAAYRRTTFGHRTVLLDPFGVVTKTSDSLNQLDFIDKSSPTAIDECRDLGEALAIRTGQEKEPHWVDSAEAWISGICAAVVNFGVASDRSLQTVRSVLSDPNKINVAIQLLCNAKEWDGLLARQGEQLTHYKDKELGSTLTTTNRFLRFLDTPAVAACTQKSTFDPAELCNGKTTVYLILPPDHMRSQSGLLRMWIGACLRGCVKNGLGHNQVDFLLDEASSLGSMNSLNDAVDKYRAYGVRLVFFYQAMGQLFKSWPDDHGQTLLSNTTQIFFGVNDPQTAEYVSGRLGEETIAVSSGGEGWGDSRTYAETQSYGTSRNGNANWQLSGRKLLKPEEVAALSPRIAVTFAPGVPPIWTTLTRYYEKSGDGAGSFLLAVQVLFFSTLLFIASAFVAYKCVTMPPQGGTYRVR
jgi:type IV secretion system protein VirD4